MPDTIIAPAPPGVQSTFDKPLGPQPSKSSRAGIWKKTFDQLTHEDVTPQGQETPPEKPSTVAPAPAKQSNSTDTVETKKSEQVSETKEDKSEFKPSSPLEAVLAKTPKEEKPAEEPDVLKEFDEKTANWQRAREVMKTQSGRVKELEAELQKAKTAPRAEPSVIEALTRERDEYKSKFDGQEEKLKAINYQYSDEFQGLIKERDNTLAKISTRVKSYGGDANALIEALSLPEGKVRTAQIKEALSEVDPDDKPRIHALMETWETQNEKISDAEKNAAPKWDELRSRREVELAEQSQASIKQLETMYGKVVEDISANSVTLREAADDVPGGTEWNQEIRSAIETGLKVLKPGGADFNQSVAIAVKGARYDTLEKRLLAIHSDYKDLQQKYNELAGSGPDFKGGARPKETPKPGPKGAKGYHETLAAVKAGEEF
jgi:hypothetical protein